jgi:hypothetical protein
MKLFIEGKQRRVAYFIPIDGKTDGGWRVGIAVENLPHYYKTDWVWDCSKEVADRLATEVNEERGITAEESEQIQESGVLSSIYDESLQLH